MMTSRPAWLRATLVSALALLALAGVTATSTLLWAGQSPGGPEATADQDTPVSVAADGALRTGQVVHRIPVEREVELGLAAFIERSLREAHDASASVVLVIDTPGGRVDAAQRIVDAISNAEVPVYALISPRAFSAGAMIALATEQIYMIPGGVIGAATPVTGEGEKAPEKMVSAMRSEMRAIAEARGLDPRIAEAMVDEEVEIEGVIEAGKLLTLTTEEAHEIGYATAVEGWDDLMTSLGLEEPEVRQATTNWAESVVRFLTHPLVTPMLLSLGFLGLLLEFKTPTFGIAGLAGGLMIALFFGSHFIIGLAGWEHVILLLAGLVFLGAEIFLIPGFGIFGIAGIIAVLMSIYMILAGALGAGADYARAASTLSAVVLVSAVSAWALGRVMASNPRFARSGILLGEATTREAGYVSAAVRSDLVGVSGVAVTDLRPAGAGQFGDERIDVVAEAGWIASGSKITIVSSEGYRHVVREEG